MSTLFDAEDSKPTTTCVAPWFGSNRMMGKHVGRELRGCSWVGIPFAGGMSEIAHIDAREILVNDLHKHIINLALCIQCPKRSVQLAELLSDAPFHPDALAMAQVGCRVMEDKKLTKTVIVSGDTDWAYDYFVCCWMGRSAKSGTDDEFKGALPIRWNANGGGSNVRYRSAVASIFAWQKIMQRCNFTCMDAFAFIAKVDDAADRAIYVDAPWPDDGEEYRHKFTEGDQVNLANVLHRFRDTRVVVRYGDHPLIRKLYADSRWTWRKIEGRTQGNKAKREVLIINGPSYAGAT